MMKNEITPSLRQFIETEIIPLYDRFDAGHRRGHVQTVIEQSLLLAPHYQLNINMVYAVAAYHDTGLCQDRSTHHLVSGKIMREDNRLLQWFTPDEVETMAQAVEDHRASSRHKPRSIYGLIVAEADRVIVPHTIIERTLQYGLANYPQLTREEQLQRAKAHLHEKYAEGGYLKLWIPESPNATRLEELRALIRDENKLDATLAAIFKQLTNSETI